MSARMQIEHKDGKTRVTFGAAEWSALGGIMVLVASGWLLHDRILTTLVAQGTATEKRLDRIESTTRQTKELVQ